MKKIFLITVLLSQFGCGVIFHQEQLEVLPKVKDWSLVRDGSIYVIDYQRSLLSFQSQSNEWRTLNKSKGIKFEKINFINESRGWGLWRDGRIFSTLDKGETWVEQGIINYHGQSIEARVFNLKFLNENDGFLSDTNSIWVTQDSGKTWKRNFVKRDTSESVVNLYCSFYKNKEEVWIGSENGEIFHSLDSGMSWKSLVIAEKGLTFNKIAFVDDKFGWVVSYPTGEMLTTEDGGGTWQERFSLSDKGTYYILGLTFVENKEGWAIGADTVESATSAGMPQMGRLLHTVDGGLSWVEVNTNLNESSFNKIDFVNANLGWLAGKDNLYIISNKGNSFEKSYTFSSK